ncbi:MAG: hypothetical protein J2O48_01410 [Solirubrobacterales bacterium]|nr:hypothetical protein [Solirubrobacterales bacterium]
MATVRKVNLPLDEDLIRRARDRDAAQAEKSDVQVVEHALTMYLGDKAFEEALAQGPLDEAEAEALAREALHAARDGAA